MRFGRKRSEAGRIDGGEGRGVRMGGPDPAAPPSGTRRRGKTVEFDDEEILTDEPSLDDLEEFDDSGDSSPGDRRRDPLRRPV